MLLPLLVALVADVPTAWTPLDNLALPHTLPRLRQVNVAAESSYDRTGGNDDGFSGKHSFVRKEGDALVIADLVGPGVVQRIWTPTPTDEPLEFYFDGEAEPRIRARFRDLFMGSTPGFPEPLVGHGAGGFWSYVPIPYARSLKILYRGPVMQFFQINHSTLPAGARAESFSPRWAEAAPEAAKAAAALMAGTGADLSQRMAPPGAKVQWRGARRRLEPGKAVTLLDARKGGRIVGMRIGPARELAGKRRDILLRITFDGSRAPAVLCPVGDFFGASWGDPAMRAVPAGTDAGRFYCWLPMPYDRRARVELVSERTEGPAIDVDAEVAVADAPRRDDEGRFYAVWRRENPTTTGKPFTFVEAEGKGHVVGAVLQAQGPRPGETPFFEGDDQATIDGKLVIHGTGSEDFFNGGWYDVPGRWDTRRSLPLSGCLDYQKGLGRTGGYRWMLPDPVVYQQSLLLTIEHSPTGNDIATDYAGVTYLYADRPPRGAGEVLPAGERIVNDPPRVVVAAGWNVPIAAFSFERATLGKRVARVGGDARVLRLQAEGSDVFGPHFVEVVCSVPGAGRYRVDAEVLAGPEAGDVQWTLEGKPLGDVARLRAPEAARRTVKLGEADLVEGANALHLALTSPQGATGRYVLDLVTLTLTRVR